MIWVHLLALDGESAPKITDKSLYKSNAVDPNVLL